MITSDSYEYQPYYSLDMKFFQDCVIQLQSANRKESAMKMMLHDYTQRMINMALLPEEFENYDEEYNLLKTRIDRMKVSVLYNYYCLGNKLDKNKFTSASIIHRILVKLELRQRNNRLDDCAAIKLYLELESLLSSRKECIELLAQLSGACDLKCLVWGLFSSNPEVVKLADCILKKIEAVDLGRPFLNKLSNKDFDSFNDINARIS